MQSQNGEGVILDVRDDAPISNPIAPQATKATPSQRLPEFTRVICARDSLRQEYYEAAGDLGVKLFQVPGKPIGVADVVGQDPYSTTRSASG